MNLHSEIRIRLSVLGMGFAVLQGCAGLTPEEQNAKRTELHQMADKTITTLLRTKPEAAAAQRQRENGGPFAQRGSPPVRNSTYHRYVASSFRSTRICSSIRSPMARSSCLLITCSPLFSK